MTTHTIDPPAMPTTGTAARTAPADLVDLGRRVAEPGPAAHHAELVLLSGAVARVAPAAAQVLGDSAAPEVARQRALAVASAALARSASPTRSPSSRDGGGAR